MANADAAFGMRAVRHLDGSPYCGGGAFTGYAFDTSTALSIGDPIELTGLAESDGIPQVKRSAAGSPIDGVIEGFLSDVGQAKGVVLRDNNRTIPADTSSGAYVLVSPANNVVFEIQEDSVVNAVELSEVGLHANIIVAAPDAINGISKVELDSTSAASDTTGGLQLQILALKQSEDNEVGNNAVWEVTVSKTFSRSFGSSR